MSNSFPPLHGTCIAWQGQGVLILGEAGSGKSGLALELIDLGAQLVADDAVLLRSDSYKLTAFAPENLKGCLALRQLGILEFPSLAETVLSLAVQLGESLHRDELTLHGVLLPSLHIPRHYSPRLALIRQVLQGALWKSEEWRPKGGEGA